MGQSYRCILISNFVFQAVYQFLTQSYDSQFKTIPYKHTGTAIDFYTISMPVHYLSKCWETRLTDQIYNVYSNF